VFRFQGPFFLAVLVAVFIDRDKDKDGDEDGRDSFCRCFTCPLEGSV